MQSDNSIDEISTPSEFAYSSDASDSSFSESMPLPAASNYTHDGDEIVKQQQQPGDELKRFLELQKDSSELFTKLSNGKTLSNDQYALLNNLITKNKAFSGIDPRDQPQLKFVKNVFPTAISNDVVGSKKAFTRYHEFVESLKIRKLIQEGKFVTREQYLKQLKDEKVKKRQCKDAWVGQQQNTNEELFDIPKMPLPGTKESYNAPSEYETPRVKFMRQIQPDYKNYFIERFNRQLDLYAAPRSLEKQVSKESLLKTIKNPDKGIYPKFLDITIRSFKNDVRSLDISPDYKYVAAGGADGILRVFELKTGKLLKQIIITSLLVDETVSKYYALQINSVEFCPRKDVCLLAVAAGRQIFFFDLELSFGLNLTETQKNTRKFVNFDVLKAREKAAKGWTWEGYQGKVENTKFEYEKDQNIITNEVIELENEKLNEFAAKVEDLAKEDAETRKQLLQALDPRLADLKYQNTHQDLPDRVSLISGLNEELVLKITSQEVVNELSFHQNGDYLLSVSQINQSTNNIAVHKISQGTSISLFKNSRPIQCAAFVPGSSQLVICEEALAYLYDLKKLSAVQKVCQNASEIGCVSCGKAYQVIGCRNGSLLLCMGGQTVSKSTYFKVPINSVSVWRDLIVAGAADGVVGVFKNIAGELIPCCVLRGHQLRNQIGVCGVQCFEGGIATCAGDGTVRIWR